MRLPSSFRQALESVQKNGYRYFIALIFVAIFLVKIFEFLTPPPPEAPGLDIGWQGVKPGQQVSPDQISSLGEIISQNELPQGTEFLYQSQFPTKPNQVVVDDNSQVVFIKEQILSSTKDTLKKYTSSLGDYDLELYEPRISESVRAYVFLESGLVVIAHVKGGQVEQKWYFQPTTKENFLQTWGQDLETTSSHQGDPLEI